MTQEEIVLEIVGLVFGVPVLLMVLLLALGRLEEAVVAPDERAATLSELIASSRAPEEVEHAAAELLASVAPGQGDSPRAASGGDQAA